MLMLWESHDHWVPYVHGVPTDGVSTSGSHTAVESHTWQLGSHAWPLGTCEA
jgi:hypothetical protein